MFPKNAPDTNTTHTPNYDHTPDEVETVVGPSVVVEGDFASEGNILVKGTVSGNVKTARLLTVEGGAKIMANVKAADAVIAGEVRGNVKVDQQLELLPSARVLGDIQCETLVIAAGALLQGKVAMKGLEGIEMTGAKRAVRVRGRADEMESVDMPV